MTPKGDAKVEYTRARYKFALGLLTKDELMSHHSKARLHTKEHTGHLH